MTGHRRVRGGAGRARDRAFIGPLAEYQRLPRAAAPTSSSPRPPPSPSAVEAGDLDRRARGLDRPPASLGGRWRRSPAASATSPTAMDPLADYLAEREAGPGLHRLPPHRVRALGAGRDRRAGAGGGAARRRRGGAQGPAARRSTPAPRRPRRQRRRPRLARRRPGDRARRRPTAMPTSPSSPPISTASPSRRCSSTRWSARPTPRRRRRSAQALDGRPRDPRRLHRTDGAFPPYDQVDDGRPRDQIADGLRRRRGRSGRFNPAIGLE